MPYATKLIRPQSNGLCIWSVIQQCEYETRVHDIGELRRRLLQVSLTLEHSLIDDAVDSQHACKLVFVPMADILNIPCDYQFFFL